MVNPRAREQVNDQLRANVVALLTSNHVSESLRLDDRDVIDDTLVGVEITGKSINNGSVVIDLTFRSISR